jgi:hypothetical protein
VRSGTPRELADEITGERAPIRVPEGGISILVWDPSTRRASAYGEDHAILDDTPG